MKIASTHPTVSVGTDRSKEITFLRSQLQEELGCCGIVLLNRLLLARKIVHALMPLVGFIFTFSFPRHSIT